MVYSKKSPKRGLERYGQMLRGSSRSIKRNRAWRLCSVLLKYPSRYPRVNAIAKMR